MRGGLAAAALAAVVLAAPAAHGQSCEPKIEGHGQSKYGRGWDMALAGDSVLVAASYGGEPGLWIYEGGAPVGRLYMPDAFGVAVAGTLAAVTGAQSGLRMVDISDPRRPREMGAVALTEGYDVAIDGAFAFVADGAAGLTVVDIADPDAPRIVARLDTPHLAWRVAVEKGVALIAEFESGLRIVDVRSPAQPVEVGAFPTPASAVAVRDGTAFIGTLGAGMLILDVQDPSAPLELGRLEDPAYVSDVAPAPPLAWLLGGKYMYPFGEDLVAVDIRDAAAPVVMGRSRIDPWGFFPVAMNAAVALRGDGAYVLSSQQHLAVFDHQLVRVDISSCALCLADCDGSGSLDFADFLCFQNLFASADPLADCDGSGGLDFFDFLCFQNQFAAGCP